MREPEAFDQLLSDAWQTLSPPSGLESRVRARLTTSGVTSAALAPASPTLLASKLRALRASGGVGASAAALMVGLGFAAGYLARPSTPALLPNVSSASAPAAVKSTPAPAVQPLAAALSNQPAEAAASAPATGAATRIGRNISSARAARTPLPAREPASSRANDELLLLERAERAVRARHPELALALIEELEQRHPESKLHEERSAVALLARCQRDGDDARPLAEAFLRRYPASVYGERITSGCKLSMTSEPASLQPANSVRTIGESSDTDGAKGGNIAQPDHP